LAEPDPIENSSSTRWLSLLAVTATLILGSVILGQKPEPVPVPSTHSAHVGEAFAWQAPLADGDLAKAETLPTWATFAAGKLLGSPQRSDLGLHRARLIQHRHAGDLIHELEITVKAINHPPTFAELPRAELTADRHYSEALSVVDADGDPMRLSLLKGPPGMRLSETKVLEWAPGLGTRGWYEVILELSDSYDTLQHRYYIFVPPWTPPTDDPYVAATADDGWAYLADVKAESARAGHGQAIFRGRASKGLGIAGTQFATAIDVHADSSVQYKLDGRFSEFRASMGIKNGGGGGAHFEVHCDGERRYYRSHIYGNGPTRTRGIRNPVQLDVSGVAVLELRTVRIDGGQGAWSAWGDPRLLPLSD
jgi:hypothetical protein